MKRLPQGKSFWSIVTSSAWCNAIYRCMAYHNFPVHGDARVSRIYGSLVTETYWCPSVTLSVVCGLSARLALCSKRNKLIKRRRSKSFYKWTQSRDASCLGRKDDVYGLALSKEDGGLRIRTDRLMINTPTTIRLVADSSFIFDEQCTCSINLPINLSNF